PGVVVSGVRRVLAQPLMGRDGRVLGVLASGDGGRPRDVATWRLRTELIAAQAAAAIERATLVERLQEEAERVRALLRVSQEIAHGAPYGELAAASGRTASTGGRSRSSRALPGRAGWRSTISASTTRSGTRQRWR